MIRFGYLMELRAGPLMLCIEFSTNACSTPQPRDLHNSKPQRCSSHLVADSSPLSLSGPAHRLVLGATCDGLPLPWKPARTNIQAGSLRLTCTSASTRTTTTCRHAGRNLKQGLVKLQPRSTPLTTGVLSPRQQHASLLMTCAPCGEVRKPSHVNNG